MTYERILGGALLLSAMVHLAVIIGFGRALPGSGHINALPPSPAADPWAGDTFDLKSLLEPVTVEQAVAEEPAATENPAVAPQHPDPSTPPAPAPDPTESQPGEAPTPKPAASKAHEGVKNPPGASASASSLPSRPAASASGAPASGPGGTFGAAGLPRGVRSLPRAFARAIPMANSGDPVWQKLPLGNAGSCDVLITVDDDRKITSVTVKPTDAPQHLRKLVRNTLVTLRASRFALSRTEARSGSERLRLSVEISTRPVGNLDDTSAGPFGLGFEAPTPQRPGKAQFTLRTGRHIEVKVEILSPS